MDKEPLFSVIIPAKNRAKYLHHTLRTCSLQDYERLEVIVADDGSTDETRDVVEDAGIRDPRIRYATAGGSVGMRENFEFALRQVKPGYVIALGADDGLMPRGVEGMRAVLSETRQELLTWAAPVYAYPGAWTTGGQLVMPRQGRTRLVRSADFLRRQSVDLNYMGDVESPMFYVKGVVATTLVDRVRQRSPDGRFYSCPTPDGYSGIVLAGEVDTFAFSARPFSIYGASPSSQGQAYLESSEEARKLSEAFFSTVADTPMHRQLASQPYSPLITLMTADYLLTAADLPGWRGPTPTIDFRQLLLKAIGELRHGLYSTARIPRELAILDRIAEQHGLQDFFRSTVSTTARFAPKTRLDGDAISPSMLVLDAEPCGVHDLVDAAHFTHFAYTAASRPLVGTAIQALVRSVRYRLSSVRKGAAFPPVTEWQDRKT